MKNTTYATTNFKNDGPFLILGAGPAGMAAAFELQKAGKPFITVEKNDAVGGLSRTLRYGDFMTDIGGHRFFSQNQSLYRFFEALLGEHWKKVDRLSRFYIRGKFFLYPVSLKETFSRMGFGTSCRIARDYLFEKAKKAFVDRQAVSFEEKVISDFGRALAQIVMLDYSEKIWGLPCSDISPDWITQRIKNLSIREIIKSAFGNHACKPKTLISRFYYPEQGIGEMFEAMKEIVFADTRNKLYLQSHPIRICHNKNHIEEIVIAARDGGSLRIAPEQVISSIPITVFVELLEPRVPDAVVQASKKLKFRSHLSLFMTLNKPRVSDNQWIYFPDREVPFGRIMEPKNWSNSLAPADKTSLLIEFFCRHGDGFWNADADALLALALPVLEKENFVKKEEIIRYYVHREQFAYPVYDLNYKEYVGRLRDYLGGFENLRLIGRGGRFRYNNIDHAMETGMLAVRGILEGKQFDLDEIGEEQAYFERGYLGGLGEKSAIPQQGLPNRR